MAADSSEHPAGSRRQTMKAKVNPPACICA
jgi:hypothetical protein